MDYSKKYIEAIKTNPSLERWKAYRYLVAIETNSMVWEDATKHLGDRIPATYDCGVDLVSVDLKTVYHTMHGAHDRVVTWDNLGSFFAYSAIYIKPERMILATNRDQGLTKLVNTTLSEHVIYNFDELFEKHIKNK